MIIRRRKAGTIGLNLTSMIDVVFLLLVYFMVATEFKTAEESFPMDVPIRNHGQTLALDNEPLVILVESSGVGEKEIRLRLEGPWDPISSLNALSTFLRSNKAGGFGNSGLFTENHPIRIKPTSDTRWEHAIATYNIVVGANYTNISLDEPL
ncbi:MAG: biopolymer transporter ExbD [Phycisphaerales bacterium]|nr:biopolymer transporter ExbD [Planctomycetota bacterium]MBL6997338.1 biopolymer transporter ExbD [Phycisphaerales bacterium]